MNQQWLSNQEALFIGKSFKKNAKNKWVIYGPALDGLRVSGFQTKSAADREEKIR
jgi:hypothetical protein